jgi:hypothetical protein
MGIFESEKESFVWNDQSCFIFSMTKVVVFLASVMLADYITKSDLTFRKFLEIFLQICILDTMEKYKILQTILIIEISKYTIHK